MRKSARIAMADHARRYHCVVAAMLQEFAKTTLFILASLLPIINPPAVGFIVLSMVPHATETERAQLARSITVNSVILLAVSLLLGAYVLAFFGISIPVLRVAGGIIVTVAGWKLLQSDDDSARAQDMDEAGHGANNHLVMGPWWHSQINRDGWTMGPLKWPGNTTAQFRQQVMIPWFQHYLRGTPLATPLPSAMIYNPVEQRWDSFSDWKPASEQSLTPLYLQGDFGLGFEQPSGGGDNYVSDPAKPVPYLARPIPQENDRWRTWLVQDQRFVETRPDVLSYTTPVLTKTVTVQGAPIADLFARTTGTDGDFVVKLIDVYPGTVPSDPTMGGYELPVSMDIFRGRYRKSFAEPSPIPANEVQEYKFRLPTVNYVFKPGHRIMVQIQSTLFPLYDRNPQTYVPNILFAKPSDYRKATITIEHGADGKSAVLLPVVGNAAP